MDVAKLLHMLPLGRRRLYRAVFGFWLLLTKVQHLPFLDPFKPPSSGCFLPGLTLQRSNVEAMRLPILNECTLAFLFDDCCYIGISRLDILNSHRELPDMKSLCIIADIIDRPLSRLMLSVE